ncbi:exported hypothetical protein [Frankia sp. Hr75.2]|nr:exported hypothetical protein [Frankia sp. Hr75.2]
MPMVVRAMMLRAMAGARHSPTVPTGPSLSRTVTRPDPSLGVRRGVPAGPRVAGPDARGTVPSLGPAGRPGRGVDGVVTRMIVRSLLVPVRTTFSMSIIRFPWRGFRVNVTERNRDNGCPRRDAGAHLPPTGSSLEPRSRLPHLERRMPHPAPNGGLRA